MHSNEEQYPSEQNRPMEMVENYEAQQMGNNPLLGQMQDAFKSLTPQELQMIDQAITPEVGALLVRALGPGLGQIFKQFYQDDPQQQVQQPMQQRPVSPMQNVTAGRGF